MNDNEAIQRELEEEARKAELEALKPPKITRWQLTAAAWVWQIGVLSVDLVTAWLVWQILYWWYGIFWILAGGGGLLYSERLRERIGNNDEQQKIGSGGVVLSIIFVIAGALFAGIVYMLGYTKTAWAEITMLVSTIGLLTYHLVQSYRYHILDDDYIAANNDARDHAEHLGELKKIHRAAQRVDAKKVEHAQKDVYRGKHGGAFDAALSQKHPQSSQNPRLEKRFADETGQTSRIAPENAPERPEPKNARRSE